MGRKMNPPLSLQKSLSLFPFDIRRRSDLIPPALVYIAPTYSSSFEIPASCDVIVLPP